MNLYKTADSSMLQVSTKIGGNLRGTEQIHGSAKTRTEEPYRESPEDQEA